MSMLPIRAPDPRDSSLCSDSVPGDDAVRVTGLYIYPVKSCGGVSVPSWTVTEAGLEYDRQWMIVRGKTVLTQKREPLLSQIKARVDLDRRVLVLAFRNFIALLWLRVAFLMHRFMADTHLRHNDLHCYDDLRGEEDIEVDLESSGDTIGPNSLCLGKVCGEEVEGYDCGREVGDWLDTVLGLTGVKLVRGVRRKSQLLEGSKSLANDSSCLVLGQASVDLLAQEVNRRCDLQGENEDQFTCLRLTQRFRPNILLSTRLPFQEEDWAQFEAGGRQFSVSGPCRRCQVIRVEQDTGELTMEPLRSLAAMKDRAFNFGVHSRPRTPGTSRLAVGDTVSYVTKL